MSARQKRTHKANSLSVRRVQDGADALGMPQTDQPVPEPKGEGVAEADTTNRQGGKMHQSIWERIELDKPAAVRIVIAVVIAVAISAVIMLTQTPSKGKYEADLAGIGQNITMLTNEATQNEAAITTVQQQYGGVANTVATHTSDIGILDGRLDTAEGDITTIEGELAAVGSPPEAWLAGNLTSGNLTLHAKASEAGNYTVNMHLVFAPPISAGNATTNDEAVAAFYATVNWTTANVKAYTPVASYNSTGWNINQVWWNVGTLALVADNDTDIALMFGGLNATPSFAYAEIYPVLK